MRRFSRVLVTAALVGVLLLTTAAIAGAAGPKLQTFGTGDVTTGSVGGASATIVNGPGEFGGVYLQSKSQSGKLLKNVTFAFTSRADTAGGAPRFSIPINDGDFDVNADYAFLDAAGCGAAVVPDPTGTPFNDVSVSTQNPACHVNFGGTDYANWAAFAAANPAYKVMSGYIPFIIADQEGTYVATDIVLR